MIKKMISILAGVLFLSLCVRAQVSVVSIQLQPFNITPESMMSAAIMNGASEQQVETVSKLYNFNNELLLTVKSTPFNLKQGLNSSFDGFRKAASIEYGSGNQSNYIKTTHGLPSGTFKICIDLVLSKTNEVLDQFCDEVESEFNQYLYLVFPADKDTIESTTPLLAWTHSEPFSVLSQGEYYRMILTEIKDKQSAQEALDINLPMMSKNYLTTHNLQYPYDAKELLEGKKYAWQVQKLVNGVVTNKTEAWEFFYRKKPEDKEVKYVALKHVIDASFYTAYNARIYFKFSEEYNSPGNIIASIKSDDGKKVSITILKDQEKTNTASDAIIKSVGDNRFVLDLNKENVKPGFYVMEIRNEKKELYYLKFYFPE